MLIANYYAYYFYELSLRGTKQSHVYFTKSHWHLLTCLPAGREKVSQKSRQ